MHTELGGFWFNLLLAFFGFLYGSYRLAKRDANGPQLSLLYGLGNS